METGPDYTFKIILVGSWGVGKTSLVRKYVEKAFSENYLPSIGAQIMGKEISMSFQGKQSKINLAIWDIAAQDTFKKMHQIFYSGAHGAFLVADLTRPESFEELLKWDLELTSLVPDIPKILLANKADLVPQVSEEKLQEMAEKIQILKLLNTSAKTGENVLDAFKTLTKQLLEKSSDVLKRDLAKKEVEWRSTIQHLYVIDHSGMLLLEQNFRQSTNAIGRTRDSSILSGALIAVSTILKDLAENDNPLKAISQEGFSILIEEGKVVLAALVTTTELKITRQRLQGFLKEFELKYGEKIKESLEKGYVAQTFKAAGTIAKQFFDSD